MFFVIGLIWVALGALPLIRALKRAAAASQEPEAAGPVRVRTGVIRGAVILAVALLILVLVNVFFGLATEYWWFSAIGFGGRFWTEYGVRLLLFAIGAVVGGAAFALGLRAAVLPKQRLLRRIVAAVAGVGGGIAAGLILNALWQPILMYVNRAPSGVVEPVFGFDVSFYLFTLPLAETIRGRLISLVVIYLIAAFITLLMSRPSLRENNGFARALGTDRRARRQFSGALGVLFLLMAFGRLLDVPGLMYSTHGAVTGVGWLEHRVLTVAHLIAAAVLLFVSVAALSGAFSDRPLKALLGLRETTDETPDADQPGRESSGGALRLTSKSWVAPVIVVAVLLLLNPVLPGLLRALVLNPNEITLEAPYIDHHVTMTRAAFGIDQRNVEVTQYRVRGDVTEEILQQNQATVENIRLWDWRALQDNLSQQQEIRLYYEFHDVDIDRYEIDGELTQMMLSVRELEKSRLAQESQTWVSRHLKYTHGYGLVALPVHEFLPQGQPNLLVQDIPPQTSTPRFELTRPEIYYGERTTDHVYVNTSQQEFDYPAGDRNVYTDYQGDGGVPIGGLLRRLVFAWRTDGYRQLFSSYIGADTRLMFRRHIVERARVIAPFLKYDRDPYPVVTEDGRIVYIIDAYTTSAAYPYSESYQGMLDAFRGVNYVRNSVKVVVDAYNGSVRFFVVTPDDPLISAFSRIFPELFTPIEQMPEDLKAHIRYPADLLTVQADLYRVYHMTDTQVFYQREDVWEFATERYRDNFQPVEPYYMLLQYPHAERPELILMLPFTPKNKNLINAWMAGRSDYDQYGTMTVYTFPKGDEVLGPRQIEARIDQNTQMSQTLSLWGQRGSEVIRGNLLAVPLFANGELAILFVEPIYLQAEDARLPEIKRIALADQSRVVWAEDFDTATRRLLGELPAIPGGPAAPAPEQEDAEQPAEQADAGRPLPSGDQELVNQATQAMEEYRQAVGDGRFADAGAALDRLAEVLGQLAAQQ